MGIPSMKCPKIFGETPWNQRRNHHSIITNLCRRSHLGFDGPALEFRATTTLFQISGQCRQLTWQSTWGDSQHDMNTSTCCLGVCSKRLDAKWTILAQFVDHLSKIAFHHSAESRHIFGHAHRPQVQQSPAWLNRRIFETLCSCREALTISLVSKKELGINGGGYIHCTCQKNVGCFVSFSVKFQWKLLTHV